MHIAKAFSIFTATLAALIGMVTAIAISTLISTKASGMLLLMALWIAIPAIVLLFTPYLGRKGSTKPFAITVIALLAAPMYTSLAQIIYVPAFTAQPHLTVKLLAAVHLAVVTTGFAGNIAASATKPTPQN